MNLHKNESIKLSFTDVAYNHLVSAITQKYEDYWKFNDLGHRADHFSDVYATALSIVSRLDIKNIKVEHICLVAYFHDLFSWSRKNHHLLSKCFILTTDCRIVSDICHTPELRLLVANACAEHRASYTGEHSSVLSELMSSADRGMPGDVELKLQRAMDYRRATRSSELSEDQLMVESIQHQKDKFGRNGYARYPEMYKRAFAEELEEMYQRIEEL